MKHLFLVLLIGACAAESDTIDARAEGIIGERTAEAYGVLAFLNGPSATYAVLDVEVGLDSRAARNIVEHVAGDRLDSVGELDAIAYVGPVAMDKLLAYVVSIGGLPAQFIEGVGFATDEAAAVLGVANGATLAELDAKLDSRAAAGIVAARPIVDPRTAGRRALRGHVGSREAEGPRVRMDALVRRARAHPPR